MNRETVRTGAAGRNSREVAEHTLTRHEVTLLLAAICDERCRLPCRRRLRLPNTLYYSLSLLKKRIAAAEKRTAATVERTAAAEKRTAPAEKRTAAAKRRIAASKKGLRQINRGLRQLKKDCGS